MQQRRPTRPCASLRAGGIILYPTDTVWGLGCDATNAAAVERIYRLKRSENKKSMLVLCASADMVVRYVNKAPGIAFEVMELATIAPDGHPAGRRGALPRTSSPTKGRSACASPTTNSASRMLRALGRPDRLDLGQHLGRSDARGTCRTWPARSSTAWISSSTPVSKANRPARRRRSSRSAKAAR